MTAYEQIEALVDEFADAMYRVGARGAYDPPDAIAGDAHKALLAAVKALAEDAERLDALESENKRIDPIMALTVKWKLDRSESGWANVAGTVRDAIDAARSAVNREG